MTEQWRAIAGFPAYEVSNHGRVRSLDRTVSFTRAGVKRTAFLRGKILKATIGSHGYRQVSLSHHAEIEPALVHVLVAAAFIGPCPAGMRVLHDDGDPLNCRDSNLYYGDQRDNLNDARRHGTIANGEKNGQAKLTIAQVRIIRSSPLTHERLADKFGVTPGAIGFVKRGETWAGLA